jgi:hypothetical protein
MASIVNRWRQMACVHPSGPASEVRPRRSRWPRDSRLLLTSLACCAASVNQPARGQDTVPWRVVHVEINAYVRSSSYGGGYGSVSCDYAVDSTVQSWHDDAGLFGTFGAGASINYECCSKGGYYYGYSYDCYTTDLGAGGKIEIGSGAISVHPGGCMEYEICSSDVGFTVVFDRPMRMVWDDCCSGNDCCYSYGCAIDGSRCGGGSEEFPGAYVLTYNGYQHGHYFTSYYFSFVGGAGEYSFADGIRFERMFPADVVPDRIVDGSDIAAILSKWGGPYDPQRTPADVNLDGQVGAEDLALVLFAWDTPG